MILADQEDVWQSGPVIPLRHESSRLTQFPILLQSDARNSTYLRRELNSPEGCQLRHVQNTHGVWLSLARALRSGRRGRRFKSCHPDLMQLVLHKYFTATQEFELPFFYAPEIPLEIPFG